MSLRPKPTTEALHKAIESESPVLAKRREALLAKFLGIHKNPPVNAPAHLGAEYKDICWMLQRPLATSNPVDVARVLTNTHTLYLNMLANRRAESSEDPSILRRSDVNLMTLIGGVGADLQELSNHLLDAADGENFIRDAEADGFEQKPQYGRDWSHVRDLLKATKPHAGASMPQHEQALVFATLADREVDKTGWKQADPSLQSTKDAFAFTEIAERLGTPGAHQDAVDAHDIAAMNHDQMFEDTENSNHLVANQAHIFTRVYHQAKAKGERLGATPAHAGGKDALEAVATLTVSGYDFMGDLSRSLVGFLGHLKAVQTGETAEASVVGFDLPTPLQLLDLLEAEVARIRRNLDFKDTTHRAPTHAELRNWCATSVADEVIKTVVRWGSSGALNEEDRHGFTVPRIALGAVAESFRPLSDEGKALAKNLRNF